MMLQILHEKKHSALSMFLIYWITPNHDYYYPSILKLPQQNMNSKKERKKLGSQAQTTKRRKLFTCRYTKF